MKDLTLVISKRIIAIIAMTALILVQVLFLAPNSANNQVYAGDGSLEVRIQYEGWREDKIPVKATFTRDDLKSIGNSEYKYTNVSDVATLLRIVARGPRVVDIIDAAGIDRESIKYIVFRTTDGRGKDGRFSMKMEPWQYESDRLYYPNLAQNYERDNEEGVIKPNKGSLESAIRVPAILGVSYYCTKNDKDEVNSSKAKDRDLLRLCIGQTELKEEEWTDSGYSGSVTSHESIQLIYGIDVILKGSPANETDLETDQTDSKVGSSIEDSVHVEKKGAGKTASVKKIRETSNKKASAISAKELVLGDKLEVETENSQIEALGDAEEYSRGALAGTIGGVVAACGAGFVLRIRKYRIDK